MTFTSLRQRGGLRSKSENEWNSSFKRRHGPSLDWRSTDFIAGRRTVDNQWGFVKVSWNIEEDSRLGICKQRRFAKKHFLWDFDLQASVWERVVVSESTMVFWISVAECRTRVSLSNWRLWFFPVDVNYMKPRYFGHLQ